MFVQGADDEDFFFYLKIFVNYCTNASTYATKKLTVLL